jgi:hypothetical protein
MKHPVRSIVIALILAATAIAAFTLALSITSEIVDWDTGVENVVINIDTESIESVEAFDNSAKSAKTKASYDATK